MSALIIEEKCRDMILFGYQAIKQFPKHETHVLGAEIRQSMLNMQRLIITAMKRYHKKTTLIDLDIELARRCVGWHAKHERTFKLRLLLLSQPFRTKNV